MAKRQRKTESDYLKARSALMRSIQRTNKAFGSNIKISDIVDVPTPAQAKKMSAAELRKMTRRIQSARKDRGEQVTFVPTGAGGVTKVSTKDYNAAMAALGKRNKALQKRMMIVQAAKTPKNRRYAKAIPVSAWKMQTDKGMSKVMPVEKIDPMTAFVGGKAFGNVDEIQRRFKDRGKVFAEAPREWKKSDEVMRSNFLKMLGLHDVGLAKKLEKLSEKQLLWAVYEGNLSSLIESAEYNNTDPRRMQGMGSDDFETRKNDGLMRKNFLKMLGFHDPGLAQKLEKLTNQQLLWATYEGNLPALLDAARYKITDPVLLQQMGLADDIGQRELDGLASSAAKMIEDIIDTASKVVFE